MSSEAEDTDVVVLSGDGLIYEGVDYAYRIEEQLSASGLRSSRHDLTASTITQLTPARAYLLTGGTTSVRSDAQWMRSAVDLVRRLVQRSSQENYAVIGVCLGSQILAEALRPDSIIASQEIEVGLAEIQQTKDPSIWQVVPAFHYQSISPALASVEGVHIEWRNAHTSVQAFSLGKQIFGCQFHPELTASDIDNLIDYNKDVIAEWGGNVAQAHQTVRQNEAALPADLFRRMVVDRIPER